MTKEPDFTAAADALTVWNPDITRRAARAASIARKSLEQGLITESTFVHASSAEECAIGDGLVRFSPGLGDAAYWRVALNDAFGIRPLSKTKRQSFIKAHQSGFHA